jgi:hypothetical protein
MGNNIFKEHIDNENSENNENNLIKKTEVKVKNLELLKNIEEIFDSFLNKKSFQIFNSIEEVPTFNTEKYFFYKYFPNIKDNILLISNYSHNFSIDILCAIYCTTDLKIDIYMDKKFITRQYIPAESYFMPICGPILISKLDRWPIIRILTENPGKIHFVYGFFSEELREFVRNNIFYTSFIQNNKNIEELLYKDGKIYLDKESKEMTEIKEIKEKEKKEGRIIIKIPEFYLNTEEFRKILANKVTENIREELLEIAMNPNRLESFMTIDEIKLYLRK